MEFLLKFLQIFDIFSLFGRAFEQAAKNTNSVIEADYFDATSKILIILLYLSFLYTLSLLTVTLVFFF